MSSTVGIIPARLNSSRLPRKLLLNKTGKPLLWYAWHAACQSGSLDSVHITTDSDEIASVMRAYGADVIMTRQHKCGTDRVQDAQDLLDADVVVNIQADQPQLDPSHIDCAVAELKRADIGTVVIPIRDQADLRTPNVVKCVLTEDSSAMYFSRATIPYSKWDYGSDSFPECYRHIGIYAYTRESLRKFTSAYQPTIERLEQLEQLRALYHGMSIGCAVVDSAGMSVDTPDDYERFCQLMQTET